MTTILSANGAIVGDFIEFSTLIEKRRVHLPSRLNN